MCGEKYTRPAATAAGRCWKTITVTTFLGPGRGMLAPLSRNGVPAAGPGLGIVGAAQLAGQDHGEQPVVVSADVGLLERHPIVEQTLSLHDLTLGGTQAVAGDVRNVLVGVAADE